MIATRQHEMAAERQAADEHWRSAQAQAHSHDQEQAEHKRREEDDAAWQVNHMATREEAALARAQQEAELGVNRKG
jgi:hypothetical protein